MRLETMSAPPPSTPTSSETPAAAAGESPAATGTGTPVPTSSETLAATTSETSEPTASETPSAPAAAVDAADRGAVVAAFQQAAAGGGPFIDALDGLGADPETVAALKPLAEKGAPSRAELTAAFPAVAEAILATEADAGLFDRLAAYGRSLVKVRPSGAQQAGDDTGAIVTRMRAAVDAGDLATALSARKALPADGQAASQGWADAVADRLEIDRLAEAIAAPPDTGNTSG
jgi:hypothetical protein